MHTVTQNHPAHLLHDWAACVIVYRCYVAGDTHVLVVGLFASHLGGDAVPLGVTLHAAVCLRSSRCSTLLLSILAACGTLLTRQPVLMMAAQGHPAPEQAPSLRCRSHPGCHGAAILRVRIEAVGPEVRGGPQLGSISSLAYAVVNTAARGRLG